ARCPPRNPRPQGSGRSPPEPSGCRASPGRRPPAHAAGSPRPGHWPCSDQNTREDRLKRSGHGSTGRPRTGNRAALVPPSRTPLVMVFESQSKTICLMNQGQRGTSIFLTPNPGVALFSCSPPDGRRFKQQPQRKHSMSPIENRPFDALQVGEEDRLVHTLTSEDFSLLATQAATIGAGLVDPTVAATRAFGVDAAQSGWASALMSALIAGRLPGAGSKLVRQTIETTTRARPGDVMTIVAKVMSKTPEGR